jgi:hypothetical protein
VAVASSDLITTLEEAREYYRARLVGVRRVTCHGHKIAVFFEFDTIHCYSIGVKPDAIPIGAIIVSQQVDVALSEVRIFSLKRARLMDHILPAISLVTVSTEGKGAKNTRTRVLHGPRLASGEYMRVVLRKGPKDVWRCVSAFPVSRADYNAAWNSRRAKFPS